MAKKLTAVVVGCGNMSGAWLGIARKDRALDVVGLVDLSAEAAAKRASEFGLSTEIIYGSLDEALKAASPDIVFDCTVPEAHYDVVTKALKAGCHVCGEKPMADSMAHAKAMLRAAEKAGTVYSVMQNRRYLPTAPALVKFLRSGAIGEITTVNVDFYIGAHFGGFRDAMDHPLLLDMAIHTFDQARQITGADPTGVWCKEFNPKGSWYKGDVSAMTVFDMTDGIVFNYRGSWCSEGFNTPWAGSWRIIGTKGTALWNEDQPQAEVVVGEEGFFRPKKVIKAPGAKPRYTGHEGCVREFLKCVRQGGVPQTAGADNIKSLAMVFGAIQSHKLGRYVKIEV